MIIRKFEEEDYKSLVDFNKIVFDNRDNIEESIIYRFYKNPFVHKFSREMLIAKNEKDEIVGQILIMPSIFTFKSKEYPAFFGMDYFVKVEARTSLTGVIIANKYKDLKFNFGIGLTDKSLAIVKAFNLSLIGYMEKYIKINICYLTMEFLSSRSKKAKMIFAFPNFIKVKGGTFRRVFDPEEVISTKRYWNHNLIEFTRSKEYINWRFFYYPDKYFVYKYFPDIEGNDLNPTWYVLRPIFWKHLNCLLLVDYRADTSNKYGFSKILESVIKVSRKLKMSATLTGCSLPGFNKNLRNKLFFKFGRKMEIVTNFQIDENYYSINSDKIFCTFADSDGDFYYGNNKW